MTPKILPGLVAVAAISALALVGCGESGYSLTQPDTVAPREPVGLAVEPVGDTLVITWSPNSEPDLAGYRLERTTDREAPVTWVELTRNLTSRETFVDELLPWARYRVQAHDNSGNVSEYSQPITYFPPPTDDNKLPHDPA